MIYNNMGYGGITNSDAKLLESIMVRYAGHTCRFLEVGTHDGKTARRIKEFMHSQGTTLDYWVVDDRSHPDHIGGKPFEEVTMILADSAEAFDLVPDDIDIAFIDGCHCRNHVIVDTVNYGAKVTPGGWMLFHDTDPRIQQTMRQGHGPDLPAFYNSVVEAHEMMGWPVKGWRLEGESRDKVADWGGITAYQKLSHAKA